MKQIILKHSELFKNLIELEDNSIYINLHNDYNCYEVKYFDSDKIIRLAFERSSTSQFFDIVIIEFMDVEIMKISPPLLNFRQGKIKIDSIYRGRFEKDGNLYDFSDNDKDYYYMDFVEEDHSMEMFSNEVKISIYESNEAH